MAVQRKPVSNLIQGVSQQAAENRRDSQCEGQLNCVNSPKDGAVPRHGADLVAVVPGDYTNAFTYEIFRGVTERYRATIKGGELEVFNIDTGEPCSVTVVADAGDYLAMVGATLPRDGFVAQTVDDFTFLANRTIKPAMDPSIKTPSLANEAMVFYKAGAYLAKYRLTVIFEGVAYSWTYRTPDNSNASNAPYIDTGQLAATFYRAISGDVPPTEDVHGAPPVYPGDPGGLGSGGVSLLDVSPSGADLVSMGFVVELNGNLIHITHPTKDFAIDVSDSVGGSLSAAFKGTARSFSDLPKTGFLGMTLKVAGSRQTDADNFYVRYTSNQEAGGVWQEVAGPDLETTLDPKTMPHLLINTGPNAFEFRKAVWSTRIAGDASTSKVPSFVGKAIEDIYYDHRRLGILTEGSTVWSKQGNPFTFFRDTVQTVLATDPIDIALSAPGKIGLFRTAIGVDESVYFWAQGVQLRATSGQDPFRQDTVEAQPSTAFEFAENADFVSVGSSLFFATEPGDYTTIRQLAFQNGKPVGDGTDITAHVSEYVPEGVRDMTASDTLRLVLVRSDGTPSSLYAYNFLYGGTGGRELIQSAWNTWELPAGQILWASIYKASLSIGLQRPEGMCLLSVPLRTNAVDDKAAGDRYRTRLDLRVTEADCTLSYDADDDETTVTLPFEVGVSEVANLRFAIRKSGLVEPNLRVRGYRFNVKSATGSTVVLEGDLTPYQFYAGFVVPAIRDESVFHLRGQNGVVPVDRLRLDRFGVKYSKTGYTRIEVTTGYDRPVQVAEAGGLILGVSATEPADLGGLPALTSGTLSIPLQQDNEDVRVRLINDSILPSKWQAAFWDVEAISEVALSKVGASE